MTIYYYYFIIIKNPWMLSIIKNQKDKYFVKDDSIVIF